MSTEMVTIEREELDNLRKRVEKLALEKSYLQLIADLVTRISSGTGLENTIDNLLLTVMDNIGGSNVAIYYTLDREYFYADIFGKRLRLTKIDDPDVQKVLETREPVESKDDISKTHMTTPGLKNAITWTFPLLAAKEIIGVFKIENIVISVSDVKKLLNLFFNYVALILYNEINSFSKLKETHEQLRISHEQLRLSEERYRSTLDTMLEGCVLVGHDWTFLYVNEANALQARMKREEMTGRKIQELFPGIEQTNIFATYKKCMDERFPVRIESSYAFPDGSVAWFEIHVEPVPEGIFLLTLETTHRKKAELDLKESQEKFLQLLNSTAEGIYGIDRDGNSTFCNNSAVKILGYPDYHDIIGKNMHHLIHHTRKDGTPFPVDACEIFKAFREGVETHVTDEVLWKADGTSFPAEYWSYPIIHDGKIKGAVVTFFDITERLKSEEQLRRSEEKYRLITENSADVIWILNLSRERFTYISPSIIHLRGYTPEEAMAQSMDESLEPESLELVRRGLEIGIPEFLKHRDTNLTRQLKEIRQPCKDGSVIWVEVATQIQFNAAGEIEVLGVSRNIDNRKKMEFEMQKNAEELRELVATRDKFFSIIAHDLKSPFNSIFGFTDFLIQEFGTMDQHQVTTLLMKIASSSKQAYALLENLLIWANLQTKRITFQPAVMNLKEQLMETLPVVEGQAMRKDIAITVEIPDGLRVVADQNMVDTIVRNLVSNAIKFTPRGGSIFVKASRQNEMVEIAIRDTGIGIPAERQSQIFSIENKTSTPGTDKEKGTGLGLILCNEFVVKQGGEIRVESKEGKGSTFRFTLPAGT